MKIENLVVGKEYRLSDDGVKKTLTGKHVRVTEVDVKENRIVVEMLEDSRYSRRCFDNFKKGQNVVVSFAGYLEEIV